MAQKWNEAEAPEVATHNNLPEVYYPAPALVAPYHAHGENHGSIPLNPFHSTKDSVTFIETQSPKSFYPGSTVIQNYDDQSTRGDLPPPEHYPRETSRRVWMCGCSTVVLILSILAAALSIAVIGLAAGTGVQSNRANSAESKLSKLLIIDRGCSTDPDSVTGTQYTSDFYDRSTFKIFCNNDAPNAPLSSLFVGNFDDCIDACASYSAYTSGNFPNVSNSKNFTCSAVSFIPDWTNRTTALSANAPGNCYLKPGPQKSTDLTHPNSDGPAVHCAIIPSS
ncbi:hypothetical protein F5Y08DRAFT_101184 [Xylaria arbuscula]|uniref:Uncharacterized protein n=1 Tax=Xylaria arbuscula TaxID=114810 RepID=A0A9W8NI26_9PEZI|nr:hypothetical protein F5Y08DRAFT_101184 [Xylaria arbuscula]KAJ3577533.1 hypothetical protein NPX13_g3035 [Xylaria arbuscula]